MPGNGGFRWRRRGDSGGESVGRHAESATSWYRHRRLKRWALGYALAVAPLPTVLLIRGVRWRLIVVILTVAVVVCVWRSCNRWAVKRLAEASPAVGRPGVPAYLPARRHVLAVVAGVLVAVMAPFWWFDDEIEARRVAALPENVAAREQVLRAEDERLRQVVAAPLPTVDGDPEIVSLRKELERARDDRPRLRAELACEADGTCGSGRVGTEEIYQAKAAQLRQLDTLIDVLPGRIEQRTAAVRTEIETARQAHAAAESRRAEIGRLLSAPPTWSGRRDALDEIAAVRWQVAVLVALAAFALHYVLDVLLLQATARWICSPRSHRAQEHGAAHDGTRERVVDDGPAVGGSPPRAEGGPRRRLVFDFRRGEWRDSTADSRKWPRRRWRRKNTGDGGTLTDER